MNDDLQIERIVVYKQDVVVNRTPLYPRKVVKKGKRGKVSMFSYESRKKLAFVAANTDVVFLTMITLTYPKKYETDGKIVKRHLRAFLQYLRRIDEGIEYLWFIEFQKRGAPHFHIVCDVNVNKFDKMEVSNRWFLIVGSGDILHKKAGTRTEKIRKPGGGARYAVKYALKMYQKKVPENYADVGRFWGHSQGVKPKAKAVHRICNENDLRLYLMRWLRDNGKRSTDYRILFGATSYLEKSTGLTY